MVRPETPDPHPLEAHLRQWDGLIRRFAARVARQYGLDVDDTHQEFVLFLIDRRPGYDPRRAKFSTWLYLVVRPFTRSTRDRSRRRVRSVQVRDADGGEWVEAPDPGPEPHELLAVREGEDRVRAAVAALPDDQRRAVVAHFWGGAPLPRKDRERRALDAGLDALRGLMAAGGSAGSDGEWPEDVEHLEPAA